MAAFEPPKLMLDGATAKNAPSLGAVLRHPTRWWPQALLEKPFVTIDTRRRPVALIADPQAASTILLNRGNHFPRSRLQDRMLGEGYGANMIQGDQQDWRQLRRDIARPITPDRASRMVPRLTLACDDIIREWRDLGAGGRIDLLRDTRRLALDALYRAMFAPEDSAPRRDPQVDSTACEIAAHGPVELKQELVALQPLAERIHADLNREVDEGAKPDLNTLTLFLHAGHDNAATALTWSLWLVAHRRDLQDAIRKERLAAAGRPFSLADHPTADAVMRESLRLYPPIMQLMREIDVDLPISGQTIPAGTTAILAIYALHRHHGFWEDPDQFLPERFLADPSKDVARAMFLPFGTGPRGCIGSGLARVELCLFISMICDRFVLEPNRDDPMCCHVEWAIRPTGKAPLLVTPRD